MLEHLQRVWIVGASTGIGHALAEALDDRDRQLYISARGQAALEAIAERAKGQALPLAFDMTDEYSVGAAAQAIQERASGLDMVIVNAGTCEYVDGPDIDLELVKRVMETNFTGAVQVINAALPLLRSSRAQGNRPKLVVMSSSVTYQALPRAHVYGASKAALRYFTECLKIDLQSEGIDVRLISPGFVKTPLTDKNDFPMPYCIDAAQAAQTILKGLEHEDFDIHFPKKFTLGLKLMARLPTRLKFFLLGKMAREQDAPEAGSKI